MREAAARIAQPADPLAIDLCCGLGGWTEGLLAEGYRVRGYDIEEHVYGDERYPAELVIRDVLSLHGSEVADAALIVASPPCQEYSYMAMPWSLAKAKAARIRADETGAALERLNAIFNACFRIQREASAAAGRHIPMLVENVRGAQPWVGPAAWNYGSYYLWGDVPALMPSPRSREATKAPGLGAGWVHPEDPRHKPGLDFTRLAGKVADDGRKNPGFRFDGAGRSFQSESVARHVDGLKMPSAVGRRTAPGSGARFTSVEPGEGRKGAGAGAGAEWFDQNLCKLSSKSSARKAASAKIAKIPFALSSHIARIYHPQRAAA